MVDAQHRSRPPRRASSPWRRSLVALTAAPLAVVVLGAAAPAGPRSAPTLSPSPSVSPSSPAPTASPTPSATPAPTPTATPSATPAPTPTPTPTPAPTGELQVTKNDSNGQIITAPGFTFNIRAGSTTGQVIATIATDSSGTAVAGALNPSTYCVEETTAADGYQVAPTYSPSACVQVAPDPTQGRRPTVVTVTDPAAIPSPSASAAAIPSSSPTPAPRATSPLATSEPTAAGVPIDVLARILVVLGVVLLGVGGVLIALSIRRRRLDAAALPPDTWYDSTIT